MTQFPSQAAGQTMCSRLGMVSGCGLSGNIKERFPRWVITPVWITLTLANVFNIGAKLAGMAEVMEVVTKITASLWLPVYAAVIVGFLFFLPYRDLVRYFQWLCLAFGAALSPYVIFWQLFAGGRRGN